MGGVNFLFDISLPKRERKREVFLSLSLSLSSPLSEKEISLFQTLQVLLDNRVLGNKSDTNHIFIHFESVIKVAFN